MRSAIHCGISAETLRSNFLLRVRRYGEQRNRGQHQRCCSKQC
jgi:hypothetical protein